MILGIGTDLANIERIEATIARFGDRFKDRVFTEREQRKAEGRPHAIAATYAKRWAAKEACSKALGTGLRMGISWKDMAVTNLRSGQPVMHLTGWAAERLREMTPPGHEAIDPRHPHRRSPLGAGLRRDRGPPPWPRPSGT
jgi:holo-[acyl-carrier protein] synthase